MRPHTKLYLKFFSFSIADFIPSEISGERAVDIHHISPRGRGGNSEDANDIENIMAVTRVEHIEYGDKSEFKEYLYKIHLKKIRSHNPNYQIKEKYLKYL